MIVYKITANGVTQYTSTGKELYCSILDKFNIEYEVIRQNHIDKNDNDIPHSDIRRMESEGVYEEKFGEPNFSEEFDEDHALDMILNDMVDDEDMDGIAELGYD